MRDEQGSSLVEVVVATAIVVAVVVAIGTALITGRAVAGRERDDAIGRVAAAARLATLTALAFDTTLAVDGSPLAITDTTTDVAADPIAAGGTGLQVSPGDALWTDRPGYVDYLDATGAPLGVDAAARARAAFVRRWAIGRHGAGTGEVATIAVLVAPQTAASRHATGDPPRIAGEPGVVIRRSARLREAS